MRPMTAIHRAGHTLAMGFRGAARSPGMQRWKRAWIETGQNSLSAVRELPIALGRAASQLGWALLVIMGVVAALAFAWSALAGLAAIPLSTLVLLWWLFSDSPKK